MSVQAVSWAFGLSLGSASQKAVLLYLAERAQDDGSCAYPSVRKIMVATELGERTVRKTLHDLCERGLIVLGDQRHAALGKKQSVIPRNRRANVWDLQVTTPLDQLKNVEAASVVEARLRAADEARYVQQEASEMQWVQSHAKQTNSSESSKESSTESGEADQQDTRVEHTSSTASKTDEVLGCGKCTPKSELGCSTCTPGKGLGCNRCTSRGAADAPKPSCITIPPNPPSGDIPPQQSKLTTVTPATTSEQDACDLVQASTASNGKAVTVDSITADAEDAADVSEWIPDAPELVDRVVDMTPAGIASRVVDAFQAMRLTLGLQAGGVTKIDMKRIGKLVESLTMVHGAERAECLLLNVIRWIPSQVFWLRRLMFPHDLADMWLRVLNDYQVTCLTPRKPEHQSGNGSLQNSTQSATPTPTPPVYQREPRESFDVDAFKKTHDGRSPREQALYEASCDPVSVVAGV